MNIDPVAIVAQLNARLARGLKAACIEVQNEAKVIVSVPAPRVKLTSNKGITYYVAGWETGHTKGAPGVSVRSGIRWNKKKTGIVKTRVYYEPSPATPDAPPRKLSGTGRARITNEVDNAALIGRVGLNLPYMAKHEQPKDGRAGLHKWLSVAIMTVKPKLAGIFVGNMERR